ncbi:U2 small nuclear ribonucleoprotein B'' [Cyphellophora attinorum]|uniref:U2 small nuclear ribonucleoprotein B n=1 Tax=Cyphellophora attinorum TaxID=1664694 RepID=A0A0N1P231_9EURO|nr:U2 small nuclear ribonucleoprotein B'' [Phialophora attinorum]KPI45852.1 U2 small nuclear ribonucleoprotein B'' [Phialophora attinorum]
MPPKVANGTAGSDAARQTRRELYVKNLNDKINKTELKRALYMLFSTYGPVLDIVTTRVGAKSQHMRGQAHIVYRDIQTSTQAMRTLQGFDFFGKELVIVYGKGQSNIIPKLRGTFDAAPAAATSEVTEAQKSIFNAPPSAIPSKPVENGVKAAEVAPHGVKRPREDEPPEEEDDQSDAPMEEDDDDAPMQEDSDSD